MKTISLTQGYSVIVDDEDFAKLNQFKWYPLKDRNTIYAIRNRPKKLKVYQTRMHRIIINANKNQMVDHINGNGLDNRKENLRLCNYSQNGANAKKVKKKTTSIYKGVRLSTGGKNWEASISIKNKRIYLGRFKTELEAALAYNKAAIKYHGKFAKLNDCGESQNKRGLYE